MRSPGTGSGSASRCPSITRMQKPLNIDMHAPMDAHADVPLRTERGQPAHVRSSFQARGNEARISTDAWLCIYAVRVLSQAGRDVLCQQGPLERTDHRGT